MGTDTVIAFISSCGSVAGVIGAIYLSARVMRMADQKVSALGAQLKAENDRDLAIASFAKTELELEAKKSAVLRLEAALEASERKLRNYEAKAIADAGGDDLLDIADRVLAGDDVSDPGPPAAGGGDG